MHIILDNLAWAFLNAIIYDFKNVKLSAQRLTLL